MQTMHRLAPLGLLLAAIVGGIEFAAPTAAQSIPEEAPPPTPLGELIFPGRVVPTASRVEEKPAERVGQIYIVGNERTPQTVILEQVPLVPGQVLTYRDLKLAEKNLARLNLFAAKPAPTLTVLDNPQDPDNSYKDILITVKEASTGSLMFGVGVNSDSGLTGSIILNERNFDVARPPLSLDDLLHGGAFRGTGQEFRLEATAEQW